MPGMLITEKKTYAQGSRQVVEYVPVVGDVPENFVRYFGRVDVQVRMGGASVEHQSYIPLPYRTLDEAFENLDAEMKNNEDRIREEVRAKYEQPRIQQHREIPKDIPAPRLVKGE